MCAVRISDVVDGSTRAVRDDTVDAMDWNALRRADISERRRSVSGLLADRSAPGPHPPLADALARLAEQPNFAPQGDWATQQILGSINPLRAAHALLEIKGQHQQQVFARHVLPVVCELCGASPWAARLLARDPELLFELADRVQAEQRAPDHAPAVQALTRSAGDFDRRLRRYRHRYMLHISLQELRNEDIRQTSRDLAALASACIQAALEHHHRELEIEGRAAVIGMGKLGGEELNLSSDIDLIYVYDRDRPDDDGARHKRFVRLFERVTASLGAPTEDGFVFRVDLDLRPEGKRGPICNSVAALERYYETWGRPWERAAWVRARPVAGPPELTDQVMKAVRPFVWRRTRDLGQVRALVDMKRDIDAQTRRRPALDLKLGKGGIREIEFIVQAHQLLHGGLRDSLRSSNTFDAIEALEAHGHLSSRTARTLEASYAWFRRLEHRVQLVEQQQTHHLPREPSELAELSRGMGRSSAEVIEQTELRMKEVAALFDRLLGAVEDSDPLPDALALLLDAGQPESGRVEAAHQLGAKRPHAAVSAVDAWARFPESPVHPGADSELRTIGARLLLDCFESPEPDRALERLPVVMRSFRQRYDLERLTAPELRRGLARLLGLSDLLSRIIVMQPQLVTLAFSPGSTIQDLERHEWLDPFLERGDGGEAAVQALSELKHEHTLRVALSDLASSTSEAEVERRLTDLAEFIVAQVLRVAEAETQRRFGAPPQDAGMAILAGGTLGAREMSYRTDLDLSVLFRGEGQTEGGTRGPISVTEYFTRVTQKLTGLLGITTVAGPLYTVDMRLRPSGNQGTLVTSIDGFRAYHARKGQLWERQALVRTRVVVASSKLAEDMEDVLATAVQSAARPDPTEIRRMKERLAREAHAEEDDPKLGRGGVMELQFVVQYLTLGADLPRTTETRVALHNLAESEHLDIREAEGLSWAYDRQRRALNLSRLIDDPRARPSDPDLPEARRRIHDIFRRVLGGA